MLLPLHIFESVYIKFYANNECWAVYRFIPNTGVYFSYDINLKKYRNTGVI